MQNHLFSCDRFHCIVLRSCYGSTSLIAPFEYCGFFYIYINVFVFTNFYIKEMIVLVEIAESNVLIVILCCKYRTKKFEKFWLHFRYLLYLYRNLFIICSCVMLTTLDTKEVYIHWSTTCTSPIGSNEHNSSFIYIRYI